MADGKTWNVGLQGVTTWQPFRAQAAELIGDYGLIIITYVLAAALVIGKTYRSWVWIDPS